jgi:DNA polymerase III delta prime subunit
MKLTHHSYIVVSATPDALVPVLTAEFKVSMPEYNVVPFLIPRVTIDDVRMLSEYTYGSAPQIMLVSTDDILHEAQQALLKTLEEPGAQTKIVFIMPHVAHLIPTILSRVELVHYEGENSDSVYKTEMQKFLASDVPTRLKWVEKFIKDNEDHDTTRSILKRYIDALTEIILNKKEISSTVLEDLQYASTNILTRGSSIKILLEHVAITLPIL